MKTAAALMLVLLLASCAGKKQPATESETAQNSEAGTQVTGFQKDSIQFYTAVKSLEACCMFFIKEDSTHLNEEGLPLELNAAAEDDLDPLTVGKSVSGMASQLDALADDEIPQFVRLLVERKDGLPDNRPKASLIMFYFDNADEAKDWVNRRDDIADDSVVYFKPKGILWADGNKAYMVETFHTPERDYVNQLKAELVNAIGKAN